MGLLGGCLGACLLGELWREFALVGVCSASVYLGVACPGGCPARALALLGLASALRLPWRLSAGGVVAGVCSAGACLGVACPDGCPAIALALLGLASALRLPWRLSAGGVVGC